MGKSAIVTSLLLAAWCSVATSRAAVPAGERPAFFPDIPGFALTLEPTVYEPANLWMFIDGAAELFLTYGFVDLHVAYYRAGQGVEVRAEVYRHDAPENAFGMYSQERSKESRFVDLGLQGYLEEGIANFLSGSTYVKLSANQEGIQAQEALMTVAGAIDSALGNPGSWPQPIGMLPVTGKIRNSEQFIAESYLGYEFFRGAYVARYSGKGSPEVFVIPSESDSAASAMAIALERVNNLSRPSERVYSLRDAHQGDMTLVLQGRFLAGILRCEDDGMRTELVEFLQTSLR